MKLKQIDKKESICFFMLKIQKMKKTARYETELK